MLNIDNLARRRKQFMNQRFIIFILAMLNTVSPFALHIFPPAAPFVRREFDISVAAAQWSVSIYPLILALTMLALGPLVDRYGRSNLLYLGVGLFSIGCVICAFAPDLQVLIIGRSFQAAGAAAGSVIARALAADLFERKDLARVFGYMSMVLVIAPMFAPFIAGFLIDGFGWRSIMWLLLVVGLLLVVVSRSAIKNLAVSGRVKLSATSPLSGFSMLITKPIFVHYLCISGITQLGIFAFLSSAPYLMIETLNRPASEYGAYFIFLSVGYVLGSYLSARMSAQFDVDRMLLAAMGIYILGVVMLFAFVITGTWSPATIFGAATLMTFANGIVQPNTAAGAMADAEGAEGSAASLTGFSLVMSGAIGLQLVGFLQDDTPNAMTGIIVVSGFICAILVWNLMRLRARERMGAS